MKHCPNITIASRLFKLNQYTKKIVKNSNAWKSLKLEKVRQFHIFASLFYSQFQI